MYISKLVPLDWTMLTMMNRPSRGNKKLMLQYSDYISTEGTCKSRVRARRKKSAALRSTGRADWDGSMGLVADASSMVAAVAAGRSKVKASYRFHGR